MLKKASEALLGPLETEIATTPCDVVYEEDRVKLKHYKPATKIQLNRPLLLVYALINREQCLTSSRERALCKIFYRKELTFI